MKLELLFFLFFFKSSVCVSLTPNQVTPFSLICVNHVKIRMFSKVLKEKKSTNINIHHFLEGKKKHIRAS
jgi:hypothetical protein